VSVLLQFTARIIFSLNPGIKTGTKISKPASDPKVDVKRCLHEPRDVDPSAPPQSANGALADPLRDPSATWAAEHGILTDHGFGHVWLHHATIWRFPQMGVPKNGWFEMGNPVSK
jgi:hypothetical protein